MIGMCEIDQGRGMQTLVAISAFVFKLSKDNACVWGGGGGGGVSAPPTVRGLSTEASAWIAKHGQKHFPAGKTVSLIYLNLWAWLWLKFPCMIFPSKISAFIKDALGQDASLSIE